MIPGAPLDPHANASLFCWKCKTQGHKPGDAACPFAQLTRLQGEQFRRGTEDPVSAYLALLPMNHERGGRDGKSADGKSAEAGPSALAEKLERELRHEYEKWLEKKERRQRRRERRERDRDGGEADRGKDRGKRRDRRSRSRSASPTGAGRDADKKHRDSKRRR